MLLKMLVIYLILYSSNIILNIILTGEEELLFSLLIFASRDLDYDL